MSEKDDKRLPYEPPQVISEKSAVTEEQIDELLEGAIRRERRGTQHRGVRGNLLGVTYPDIPCMPFLNQIVDRLDDSSRSMRDLAERALRSSEIAAQLATKSSKELMNALELIVTQKLRIRELEREVKFLRETTVPRSGIKDIPDYSPSGDGKPRTGKFRSDVKIYVQGEED